MCARNPAAGLLMFVKAWNKIVEELLAENPWVIEKYGSPKGEHKFICHENAGAFFLTTAEMAFKNDNHLSLDELVTEWADGELVLHGQKLSDFDATTRANIRKRIKKKLQSDFENLIKFGLFENVPGEEAYALTAKGTDILKKLKEDDDEKNINIPNSISYDVSGTIEYDAKSYAGESCSIKAY